VAGRRRGSRGCLKMYHFTGFTYTHFNSTVCSRTGIFSTALPQLRLSDWNLTSAIDIRVQVRRINSPLVKCSL
jgi:hypothetical protein